MDDVKKKYRRIEIKNAIYFMLRTNLSFICNDKLEEWLTATLRSVFFELLQISRMSLLHIQSLLMLRMIERER
jgi:hypothetical protein